MPIELNQVCNQDCLAGMRSMEDGCIQLAFADPPFNIGYEYDVYDDRKPRDRYLDWTRQWMGQVARVLAPNGTFWLAIGDEYAAELKLIATERLGLTCRSWVIWYYTFGVHCKRKFTRSHTHLLHFVKDPKRFTFNVGDIRVPSARLLVYADGRANPDGRVPDDTWILRPQDVPRGFGGEEDTWYYPRVCGTFRQRAGWHGCQMPERVLERIIRVSSNPGDLVLDPFAGSGTTLAVAKKLHRKWIGFEISRAYARRAQERLNRASPGDPIDGPENPFGTAPPTGAGRRLDERRAAQTSQHAVALQRPGVSPIIQRVNFSLGQIAAANGELNTAIAEAYLAASDGYAIDRVLADPRLNAVFLKACGDLGIPGDRTEWNRRLLRLRKAGRLGPLPPPRRTVVPWEELEQFAFASELAWQVVASGKRGTSPKGVSLDDILCDADLVAQFDGIAARFAPGWTPFHYRWGALTVRKAGRLKKCIAAPPAEIGKTLRQRQYGLDELARVPDRPGLYVLQIPANLLYLGDASCLRKRLEIHQAHVGDLLSELLPGAAYRPKEVGVAVLEADNRGPMERSALRVHLVSELCPLGNHIPRRRAC